MAACEGVTVASALQEEQSAAPPGWNLAALAGRFVEVTGQGSTAALTLCAGLVLEAQQRSAHAAWITGPGSVAYPPDLAASGIDLRALPFVQAQDLRQAARAADTLLRSKAFALILLDLGDSLRMPLSMQTRLSGLAQQCNTTLLAITRYAAANGSLVSLRAQTAKERVHQNRFLCTLETTKDKRSPAGWQQQEIHEGMGMW